MPNYNARLNGMLNEVDNRLDKRQGSIVHDALAPTALELTQSDTSLEVWKEQTYLMQATGNNLDLRAGDEAMGRFGATQARRIAVMFDQENNPVDINIGDRFATPNNRGGIPFIAVERLELGKFILQCELLGSIGNEYYGDILPLTRNNNLGIATIVETQVPARDVEEDEVFRQRILERKNFKAFGGNIADYKRIVRDIPEVGDLKVFPVWNGGGTVLLSIIDANFDPISEAFKTILKELIDPALFTGQGIGLAPIGHRVTITTPTKYIINVEATVTLDNVTIGQIQTPAENNINNYLKDVRHDWGNNEQLNIFALLISTAIFNNSGVVNVKDVKLNGYTGDLILTQTPQLQELPYIGVVTLREG